jgi:hypothetical protein
MEEKNSPAQTLTWWVPFCAGGLCDRLLGLSSTYCLAEELNRHFLIKWDLTDVSSVLTINPEHNFYTYNVPAEGDLKMNLDYMSYFRQVEIEKTWAEKPHIYIWANLNIFFYFCQSRPWIEYKKKFLLACSTVFAKFLLPIPEVELEIPPNLQQAIGIHIRTHDNQFALENVENRKKQIPYIKDILLRCKKSIDENGEGQTVFIASDCELAIPLARIEFGPEYTILGTSGPIIHSGTETVDKTGLIRVVADLFSLARCKLLYLGWHTNFSRFAALLNAERKFYTYEHPEKKREIAVVSIEELMNYFSQTDRYDR